MANEIDQYLSQFGSRQPWTPEDEAHYRNVLLDEEARQNLAAQPTPAEWGVMPSAAGPLGDALGTFGQTMAGPLRPVSSLSPGARREYLMNAATLLGLGHNPLTDVLAGRASGGSVGDVGQLLSIYNEPVRSWPGEEALDEEARANYQASQPQRLPTEGGAIDQGSLLPITRYPTKKTGPADWKSASDVMASLDDGWRIEPFSRLSAPFKSMAEGLRTQPLLGPMVRPSQMQPEVLDQMTGDAMSVAGAGIMGNVPRVLGAAAPGTMELGIFGGRKGAETLAAKGEPRPLQALDTMERMEKAGASREEIWAATSEILKDSPYAGAFRGVDAQPKFEIDDSGSLTKGLAKERFHNEYDNGRTGLSVDARAAARAAAEDLRARISRGEITKEAAEAEYQGVRAQHQATIDRGREIEAIGDRLRDRGSMPEVFHHPDVYAAYPDIARVRGDVRSDVIQGAKGEWVPGNNVASSRINLSSDIDNPQRRSTVLHEIQHGIQEIEGFGQGTNPTLARDMPEATRLLEERTAQAAAEYRRAMDEYRSNPTAGNRHAAERASSVLATIGTVPGSKEALEVYLRHAGETEARTVQARRDLSPDERRARPPWMDYDVPEGDQIVRFGNSGASMSMPEVPRSLDPLGYYSPTLEAAHRLSQAKGTPEQMLAQLKKAGAKDAEIEATGLGQLLQGKKSVTRDEIIQHMEGNRPNVHEVRYAQGQEALDDIALDEFGNTFDSIKPAQQKAVLEKAGLDPATKYGEVSYADYSLDPSNPTYRETVLHLPEPDPMQAYLAASTPEARAKLADEKAKVFRSGHFTEQPNIVGHMMTSETINPADGKKVFTVDQIQSDWGQKLRDGGVRDEAKIAGLKEQIRAADARWNALGAEARTLINQTDLGPGLEKSIQGSSNPTPSIHTYLSYFDSTAPDGRPRFPAEVRAKAQALYDQIGDAIRRRRLYEAELATAEASAPGHPMVNTTDQWTNLVLRRALRQAAEANAEYIAIPSGDTVLSYNPGDSHGMNEFYNKIVPKNLKNILSKMDKGIKPERVETLDSPSGAIGLGQGFTLFRLTPDMKAKILREGQPMFAKGGSVLPRSVPEFAPAKLAMRAIPRPGARDADEILNSYTKD